MNDERVIKIVRWVVIIAMPFMLTIAMMRLVIAWNSPSYPEFEYGRIAQDRFGFTQAERLELAEATLGYLRRPEPAEEVIYLLEDLRLPGTNDPLYNSQEISHMLDVKKVADNFKRIMWGLGVLVVGGLAFLLARPLTRREGYKALFQGGLLTAGILLVMGLLVALAWNFVFVEFHEILFPPGTWTFSYEDSLIRLFPEQFWFDFGILWTGGIFVMGIVIELVGYFLLRRSEGETAVPLAEASEGSGAGGGVS
ncbi:MAG: TIGR01906 family membrane protein [Candidatus Promineifilaceae bacterium]